MTLLAKTVYQAECVFCHARSEKVSGSMPETLLALQKAGWFVRTQPFVMVCRSCAKEEDARLADWQPPPNFQG